MFKIIIHSKETLQPLFIKIWKSEIVPSKRTGFEKKLNQANS